MKNQTYTELIKEIMDITNNVEGSGIVSELDRVFDKYANYLNTTPLPMSVATWLDNFIDLMNNVEGSELERELAKIKLPVKA